MAEPHLISDAPERDIVQTLGRIAAALERLAPPPPAEPDFAEAKVFRHEAQSGRFIPAPLFPLALDLLVGVESQKARVVETLSCFAAGHPANHVLLWGSRGAGKSALAKASFAHVAASAPSLRLIEADRDDVACLPTLFERLRRRAERFVVFCDDLSFEEGAAAAKALKSALEGGVSGPPPNVILLATSNRRHLMPRAHGESGGPMSAAEDREEEVSASDRFGLWIGFPPMTQEAYLEAVNGYAARFDLDVADLEDRALKWARLRGARSGRIAWQFTRQLAGELGRPLPS
ncbi:MAG: ATP-binding protein [Alphaproteobacteria bacterium]|nr:ATP-binding protein [Alphaproteobacteria bacterium]